MGGNNIAFVPAEEIDRVFAHTTHPRLFRP